MKLLEKIRFSKKAQEEVWSVVIGLTVVLVVALIVVSRLNQANSSNTYEKVRSGTDVQLDLITLWAAPNDVVFSYPQDTLGFTYAFTEDILKVYNDNSEKSFRYYGDLKTPVEPNTIYTSTEDNKVDIVDIHDLSRQNVPIVFVKTKNKVRVFRGLFTGDDVV